MAEKTTNRRSASAEGLSEASRHLQMAGELLAAHARDLFSGPVPEACQAAAETAAVLSRALSTVDRLATFGESGIWH